MLLQLALRNRPFLFLLSISILAPFAVDAILQGELISLERHGYLVKILARDESDGPVRSCTGSLISASLVLTSGQCVVDQTDKGKKLRNFVVSLRKPNEQEFRSTAKLLVMKADASWALLRIPPQNVTELCPPSPAPKWVSRLNFRPSLTANPRLTVNVDSLEMTTTSDDGTSPWSLVGFSTTEKPEDFVQKWMVLRIFIDRLDEGSVDGENEPKQWRSRTFGNYTACYDDGGAPLFFRLPSMHPPSDPPQLQLGIFQSLSMPITNEQEEENSLEKCLQANRMHFSLFHEDVDLARAIERYALAEFVAVYQKCGFSPTGEEEDETI